MSQSKGKGKQKSQSWSAKMVCLHSIDATRVPCTVAERECLLEAGLGEKRVAIEDLSCSPLEFKSAITAAFPKLHECGGFEFLRCLPNSKQLEPISASVAQSPNLLKSVVANGRVFIRPIQRNLSLLPDEKLNNSMLVRISVKCSCNIADFMLSHGRQSKVCSYVCILRVVVSLIIPCKWCIFLLVERTVHLLW